ncbi:aminoglycoside adenylyltransferase domain-containing protein [Streptomyces sp. S.PB5]|uniref:aminoglycoside adenylyltransferase domain-containing protein n=1 Tax=Streptomyces sp. S.PB5 TaxID=3020844 RepID=UPI0025B0FAB4|nr:aminoglycoside adenylyltransferase domain-containing protein [Streptomyces sp. S.PB5]MDN3027427.1 DUF4111 domain-containing protein [Streptomyces sp. S.PB5]
MSPACSDSRDVLLTCARIRTVRATGRIRSKGTAADSALGRLRPNDVPSSPRRPSVPSGSGPGRISSELAWRSR